jgi:hypothetical protein
VILQELAMTLGFLALLATPFAPPAIVQPDVIDIAPAPHAPTPPVQIVPVKGGYQVYLNRPMAERLADALGGADEKEIAAKLKKRAKEKKEADPPDEQAAATLEMIAFAVSTQLPGFKKALAEKMGPNGVVVTLTGFQSPTVKFKKPRPTLERGVEVVRGVMPLLPEEAREVVEAMRAVARTKPLFWKVEPRE